MSSFQQTAPLGDRVAVVAGATGLVGEHLVRALVGVPRFRHVLAVVRRPTGWSHPRLTARIVDFDRLDTEPALDPTDAFCALGTTIAAAGSQEAFRKVDLDRALAFAAWARSGGATRFLLVSSLGADSRSRNFYLRTKGELEDALRGLGFESLTIARPGLLLGERTEPRPTEAVARAVAPVFNPLLVGPLRRYRAVAASDVAAALIGAALQPRAGVLVLDGDELVRLASEMRRSAHA